MPTKKKHAYAELPPSKKHVSQGKTCVPIRVILRFRELCIPMKTCDISFFSTLEMNNVKKGLSGDLKTIFVRILVRKMIKLWSQRLLFSPFQCAL